MCFLLIFFFVQKYQCSHFYYNLGERTWLTCLHLLQKAERVFFLFQAWRRSLAVQQQSRISSCHKINHLQTLGRQLYETALEAILHRTVQAKHNLKFHQIHKTVELCIQRSIPFHAQIAHNPVRSCF